MNKQDIVPQIELQDIGVTTVPGVYLINGLGYAVIEQIEYPHERTNLRLVVDVEVLQRQEMQLRNAKEEANHYLDQTIKLRGQLNHENGVNGIPRLGDPSDGK